LLNTPELVVTGDGSHSLYVRELDEQYHSRHGALQESEHVFIQAGLYHFKEAFVRNAQTLSILEVGFGTGLNALLTCLEAQKLGLTVQYTSLEAYPLAVETVALLNYPQLIGGNSEALFTNIHTANWDECVVVLPCFSLDKQHTTLQKVELKNGFQLIYFDAFAPDVQPELWTEEIFQKLYNSLAPNGCLVTYCAKGVVKRTLKKVGFTLKELPGPPGKREMVRATKA
jgi:tRNA U34 5-methylaminomethyl-2-thiouridine-forming methyltransferase MnmC